MPFVDTRWSLVLKAGLDTEEGRNALNLLCRDYIEPLTQFLVRRGFHRDIAEELLQSFFLKLLEKDFLQSCDPQRGRFRSFLITALMRSVANDLRNLKTLKRGAEIEILPLEEVAASNLQVAPRVGPLSPEQLFHRDWALQLLKHSLSLVEQRYRSKGKDAVFQILQPALAWDSETLDHTRAAEELGVTVPHVRVLIHRLRRDFKITVSEQIMETLANPAELESELLDLACALSGTARL